MSTRNSLVVEERYERGLRRQDWGRLLVRIAAVAALLGLVQREARAQFAGCSGTLPAGLVVVDELRHDDGSGPTLVVSAGGPGGVQREIVHANRFSGSGQVITHVCIYAQSPGEPLELELWQGNDISQGDVRPANLIYTQSEIIAGGWQLITLSSPQTVTGVFWIAARFPGALPSVGHMGVGLAQVLAQGQAFVGIMPGAPGGQEIWTDYDLVSGAGSGAYYGNRPILRGLNLAPQVCTGAGIVAAASGSNQTTENGGATLLSVALTGPVPTHNVVMIVESLDPTEGKVSPSFFSFTPVDYTIPQVVSVIGQDDTLFDGDQPYSVSILASSLDTCYHGLSTTVSFVNLENDVIANYMRVVPGGGAGPQHCVQFGKNEITNQQYSDFLNQAELDGGATGLSSGMLFGTDGSIAIPDGNVMFQPAGVGFGSRILYNQFAALGERYSVEAPIGVDPRTYRNHPATNMSWLGAVKFCNFSTLVAGLAPSERCYSEGTMIEEWHPATISTSDWLVRDLNNQERTDLVQNYDGFRLPMDNLGTQTGWVSNQANRFNEWYKAAAYDRSAPNLPRFGPGGEIVPGEHWTYAFGRDLIAGEDANFLGSGDPFDDDDAIVGMFDGSLINPGGGGITGNGTQFQTQASANVYAINDLSGNIWELIQDKAPAGLMAMRGGSWLASDAQAAASYRDGLFPSDTNEVVGFRIAQGCNVISSFTTSTQASLTSPAARGTSLSTHRP